MATVTRNPTAFQTPDATLGGNAVTTPSNTGHALTQTQAADGGNAEKSARWHTFQTFAGVVISASLKIGHSSDGLLIGAGAFNSFLLEYSLNGGGAWNTAVLRTNVANSAQSGTFSVALPAGQDFSQVQVRNDMNAITLDVGESAETQVTISSIRIEIVTTDSMGGGMM